MTVTTMYASTAASVRMPSLRQILMTTASVRNMARVAIPA